MCVDDAFPNWVYQLYRELPVKGHTYTVRQVRLARSQPGVPDASGTKFIKNGASEQFPTVGILLNELKNPDDPWGPTNNQGGTELGFNAERFREIEDISESESLSQAEPQQILHPVPVLTPEPLRH